MKFLIIRFSSIGDIVLTTPVIRCLKKQVPAAEIHFLTKHSFSSILQANPYISKVHLFTQNIDTLLPQLKNEHFDFIIDLHNNIRTWRLKRGLKKVKSFSFNKLNWQKWLYTTLKINRMPPVHIVDRYLQTVKKWGVENDGLGLDYFIPQTDYVLETDLPAPHQVGFIGLVIGASYATKKLTIGKLQQLCNGINHPIILLGGPEDSAVGQQIAAINQVKIYNACGKFSLNESADIVRRSKLIISHDTGLMHIAAAFKKPIISIWGNTVPAFGMVPYYGKIDVQQVIFKVKKLWCRPCSKLGYATCPLGHFKCMELQNVPAIAETATKFLEK